jgi:hypothetical protein
VEFEESDDALAVKVDATLPADMVDGWAAERFPETFQPDALGEFMDDEGEGSRLVPLAFAQVLIADLTQKLRRRAGLAAATAAA